MAACAVEQMPVPGGGNAFNSITLFECTMQNASMLVESMADRELVMAMKIVSHLNNKIIDVMEPRYDTVFQRSEDHLICEQNALKRPSEIKHSQGNLQDNQSFSYLKDESNDSYFNIKQEVGLDMDEEDCIIMDDDLNSVSNDGSVSAPKRSRLSDSGSLMSSVNIQECKNALRSAYKELKGHGPHLFDFSLPFDDPINRSVANNVLSLAQTTCPVKNIPEQEWWKKLRNIYSEESCRYKNKIQMRRSRCRYRKVTRRQKSFELLASKLSTESFDKYRLLLTRDYTSSDEEGADDGSLKVRKLPWESDEMREMKEQLDTVYYQSCASTKQRSQLDKIVRDSSVRSNRPPPEGAPVWATRSFLSGGGDTSQRSSNAANFDAS